MSSTLDVAFQRLDRRVLRWFAFCSKLNFGPKQPRYDKPVEPRGPTSADRFMHPPNSLSHRLTPLTQAGLHLSRASRMHYHQLFRSVEVLLNLSKVTPRSSGPIGEFLLMQKPSVPSLRLAADQPLFQRATTQSRYLLGAACSVMRVHCENHTGLHAVLTRGRREETSPDLPIFYRCQLSNCWFFWRPPDGYERSIGCYGEASSDSLPCLR